MKTLSTPTLAAVAQPRLVRLCELHEDLGKLQPRLQFKHPLLGWIESGVITARVFKATRGQYREILEPNVKGLAPDSLGIPRSPFAK